MDITVILCTFNRSRMSCRRLWPALLPRCCRIPIGWEVLVVDNNSKDKTREVVDEFRDQYPDRFRYLFEPQPGKSHALNAGIQEARGDILAFMDDDVIVEPTWLELSHLHCAMVIGPALVGGFCRNGVACPQGGCPVLAATPLLRLVVFDLGLEAGPLHEAPFGTNMAFRRTMFDKYGGLSHRLGTTSWQRNPE